MNNEYRTPIKIFDFLFTVKILNTVRCLHTRTGLCAAAAIEAVARRTQYIAKASRKERPTEATLRLLLLLYCGRGLQAESA